MVMKNNVNLSAIICICVLLLTSLNLGTLAQSGKMFDCFELQRLAQDCYYQANFVDAAQIELKRYQCSGDNEALYNAAQMFAMQNNADSAFYYLEKAVESDSSMYRLTKGTFFNLVEDFRWRQITEKQLIKFEMKFGHIKCRDIALLLCDMLVKDDAYHELIAIKPDMADSLWALKKVVNAELLKEIKQITDSIGWPKISEVGVEFSMAPFMVVLHSGDLEVMRYYLKMIRKSVRKQDALPMTYAYLIDRIRLREKRKQLYGTQMTALGKYVDINSVTNVRNINKRRERMGLSPCYLFYTP